MTISRTILVSHLLVLVSGTIGGAAAWAQQPNAPLQAETPLLSQTDERAIQRLLKDQETAWNKHDMKAFTLAFRDDAEGVNVVGMYWRGKAAILQHLTDYHATILREVEEYIEEVEIHAIDETHAITVSIWKVDGFTSPSGVEVPPCRHRSTLVLAKGSDGWKVVHFHNTVIDETAQKETAAAPDQQSH